MQREISAYLDEHSKRFPGNDNAFAFLVVSTWRCLAAFARMELVLPLTTLGQMHNRPVICHSFVLFGFVVLSLDFLVD